MLAHGVQWLFSDFFICRIVIVSIAAPARRGQVGINLSMFRRIDGALGHVRGLGMGGSLGKRIWSDVLLSMHEISASYITKII